MFLDENGPKIRFAFARKAAQIFYKFDLYSACCCSFENLYMVFAKPQFSCMARAYSFAPASGAESVFFQHLRWQMRTRKASPKEGRFATISSSSSSIPSCLCLRRLVSVFLLIFSLYSSHMLVQFSPKLCFRFESYETCFWNPSFWSVFSHLESCCFWWAVQSVHQKGAHVHWLDARVLAPFPLTLRLAPT